MSNLPVAKTKAAIQTAVIRYMADGSLEVKLSGAAGINARMLDQTSNKLYAEVNRLRALERVADRQALIKKAEEDAKKAAEEEAKKLADQAKTEEVKV
jgi:hypothetical protein